MPNIPIAYGAPVQRTQLPTTSMTATRLDDLRMQPLHFSPNDRRTQDIVAAGPYVSMSDYSESMVVSYPDIEGGVVGQSEE